MNILFINSARTWGGTEKWVRMAAESLSVSHKVSLVYRRAVVGDKIAVHKYRLPCISHFDLYSLAKLVEIIKKDKIDILIPTKRKDYVLAGLAARICGITNILRLGIVRELKIPIVHKLIYSTMADGIIVNAEKTREALLQSPFMKGKCIKVIYNGLDTDQINENTTQPIQKPAEFLITTMGILTQRKGFDFLIRGFARFIKENPNADIALIIIGEGPDREKLIALSKKLDVAELTYFTGFLHTPFEWLRKSDVFAMTSINEGISNALLEAIYLNNAPISTRAGGATEVITDGENGFLVPYGDEEQLTLAMKKLFTDRSLTKNIALKARQKVIEQFSIEHMNKKIENFCKEMILKKQQLKQ